MTRLCKWLIARHRKVLLEQILAVSGLMQLLMKARNTPAAWTPEELGRLRTHLRALAKLVPLLVVFLLPGGVFLLPALAEVLDRRARPR